MINEDIYDLLLINYFLLIALLVWFSFFRVGRLLLDLAILITYIIIPPSGYMYNNK